MYLICDSIMNMLATRNVSGIENNGITKFASVERVDI